MNFNFKKFFQLKELVWVNITVAVFFIGFNVYFAYIGNYIIYYLGYSADQMGIIEAVPLVLSMLTAIPASKLINNNKHVEVSIFAIIGILTSAGIFLAQLSNGVGLGELGGWSLSVFAMHLTAFIIPFFRKKL